MTTKGKCTPRLRNLARSLLSNEEMETLQAIIDTWPSSYEMLVAFDLSIGGPNFTNINCDHSGRYHVDDREIFRPLQYIGAFFSQLAKSEKAGAWHTREIVHMGGLQLESLVKRVAGVDRVPLGQALAKPLARRRINEGDWKHLRQFTQIYNSAKHDVDQLMDTHLFSVEDAILSYFAARKLASSLYPLAKLHTDLAIFASDCS